MAETNRDCEDSVVVTTTDETIANRVRLRRRGNDNKTASNSDDAEEVQENMQQTNSSVESLSEVIAADEFVGVMTSSNTVSQIDTCVALKRGSLYLCNMCPFEATDVNTVIRHLFAAHVFRCGMCKFYCTSRWDLRKHERNLHGSFSGGPSVQRLSLRRDDEFFSLIDSESNHLISKFSSSSTPRLMNGIGSPEYTVRPDSNDSVKQQQQQQQQHQIDESGMLYCCHRCTYMTTRHGDIVRHCVPLTRFEFLCSDCHFGSSSETVVKSHVESCKHAAKSTTGGYVQNGNKNVSEFYKVMVNSRSAANLTNGTCDDKPPYKTVARNLPSKKVITKNSPKSLNNETSNALVRLCPKDNFQLSPYMKNPRPVIVAAASCPSNTTTLETHQLSPQNSADVAVKSSTTVSCKNEENSTSVKPKVKQATFVLKRSYSDAELFPLCDQMSRYSRVTLEKIYGPPNDVNIDTNETLSSEKSELIRALKLVDRSVVLLENKRHRLRESLYESDGASHQFVLASGPSPICPCPSEFCHFVGAKPIPYRTVFMARPKPSIIREAHKLTDGTQYFLCSKCRVVIDPSQVHRCSNSSSAEFCNETDIIVID